MAMNDRYYNRGYGPNKKPYYKRGNAVNYVPKVKAQAENAEKLVDKPEAVGKREELPRKITRETIVSLYKRGTDVNLITEWARGNKEIYSIDPIQPEFAKEFPLSLSACLAVSRKSSNVFSDETDASIPYNTHKEPNRKVRPSYNNEYYDEDVGIVEGQIKKKQKERIKNAPLWFNDAAPSNLSDDEEDFAMADFAKRQEALEEEKRAFFGEKIEEEGEYSKIDELFEKKAKGPNKVDEIFATDTETVTAGINAIDLSTLESNMLKSRATNAPVDENDDGIVMEATESVPIWDSYTAEEIQKQSKEHMDNWGLDTVKMIDTVGFVEQIRPTVYNNNEHPQTNISELFQSAPIVPPPTRISSQNPFCPGYLHIRETDPAWYYKDLQEVIRGPFSSLEMYRWYMAEYFPPTLEIRFKETAPFIALDAYIAAQKKELSAAPVPRYQPNIRYNQPSYSRYNAYSYVPEKVATKVEFRESDFPVLGPKVAPSKAEEIAGTKQGTDKKDKKAKEAIAKNVLGFF